MRPAPVRLIGDLEVWSVFLHEGPASSVVRALKFSGLAAAGRLVVESMAPMVAPGSVLVPVPRGWWRQTKFGIDTATFLAEALARTVGARVAPALAAPPWSRAHTGRPSSRRHSPSFILKQTVPPGSVLIDDVLTTGSTLLAAAALTGSKKALTFTSTGRD